MVAVVGSTPAEEVQLSLEVLWEMAVKEAKDFFKKEWAEEPGITMLTQVLMEVRVHSGAGIDAGGGGGYSERGCGENVMSPVEEGKDLTILQGISEMNVVTIQLDMVK